MKSNPYLAALAIVTALLAAVTVILYIVGGVQAGSLFDSGKAVGTFAVASTWLAGTISALVVTLAANAIAWRLGEPLPLARAARDSESLEEGQRAAE